MLQAQRNVSGPMRQQEQQVGVPASSISALGFAFSSLEGLSDIAAKSAKASLNQECSAWLEIWTGKVLSKNTIKNKADHSLAGGNLFSPLRSQFVLVRGCSVLFHCEKGREMQCVPVA